MKWRARSIWLGAGILLMAFALRVFRLGDANVWWDEGLAMWAVRKSFWETTRWTACDVHPPLYFWTLWPWTRLVGYSEFAARFITVMVGLLTVALLVPLGKRLGGWQLGLLAAGLLAVGRFHVWWSQEMRMYALAALLHVAALLALTRWWETRSRRAWLAYVLATTGGLYTIYLSAVMLVVHNVWVGGQGVVGEWRNHQSSTVNRQSSIVNHQSFILPWILAQLVILALFIPWFAFAAGCMSSWSVAEPVNYSFVLQLQATLLTLGISTNLDAVLPLVVGLTLVLGAGVMVLARRREARPYVALLLLVLALPSLVIFALALPRGLFYNPRVEARYFLPFAPPVYLLFAWGLLALARWRRVVGAVALGCVLAAFAWSLPQQYADRYLRDDLQGLVQALRAYARPTDRVVLVSGDRYPIFLYYYDRLMPDDRPPVEQVPHSAAKLAPNNVDRELSRVTRDQDRVWLAWVNGPLQDPQELAPAWLQQHYQTSLSYGFAHNSLTLFTPDGALPAVVQPPTHPLTERSEIDALVVGYDVPAREYRPGDVIHLGIYWNGTPTEARVGIIPPLAGIRLPYDGVLGKLEGFTRPVQLPQGPARVQVDLPVHPLESPGPHLFGVKLPQGVYVFGQVDIQQTNTYRTDYTPLDARLGDAIRLVGVNVLDAQGERVTQLKPSATVNVDLIWQADKRVETDYTAFVHLLGTQFNPATQGPVWAGHDSPPGQGLYPTSWWDKGGLDIRDRHPLVLPADLPPGDYQLEIGLYDAKGERLPTSGAQADPAQRRILGPSLRVSP